MREPSEQERFWQGEFGTDYTRRNTALEKARQPFFQKLLQLTENVGSICELGANRGLNLLALQALSPEIELHAVEINAYAFEQLEAIPDLTATCSSIQDFEPRRQYDLVFVSGVLIHVKPADLPLIYKKLFTLSKRYILINEYYNPTPLEIPYRGHQNKLFKRDFASEFLDLHDKQLNVIDYGFLWQRLHPAWDNTTWVLMEKQNSL